MLRKLPRSASWAQFRNALYPQLNSPKALERSLRLRESSLRPYPDSHSFTIDPVRQELAPIRLNRRLHSRPRGRIDEQSHTATPSGAANFAGQRALPSSGRNHAIHHRRRNCGQIPATEGPFVADEPAGFLPIVSIERCKEPPRHVRDARQIAKDSLVTLNVPRENFPIVYPVLLWLARVAEDEPPLQFVQVAADFLAPLAARLQTNRAGAAKRRRIMVLRACGHANHDCFHVAADVDPIFQAQSRARQPVQ